MQHQITTEPLPVSFHRDYTHFSLLPNILFHQDKDTFLLFFRQNIHEYTEVRQKLNH
jgi:hypothetical protein